MAGQFIYKKVLVLGATSGIGKALASKFVNNNIKVVVTGRRKENLDEFVQEHGKDKAEAIQFDITQLDKILSFAKSVMESHPEIDCVFLNSGIQRHFNFAKPETVDLNTFDEEFKTNYISYIHLTTAFLPYLQKQQNQTSLMYTSSGLALVPIPRYPGYCATKAALHSYLLTLREQLKSGPGNVKIIELFPPAVQTELHDTKHQPDMQNGNTMGMPLNDYIEGTWAKLTAGEDQVPVGTSENSFNGFEKKRQEIFHHICEQMTKMLGNFVKQN